MKRRGTKPREPDLGWLFSVFPDVLRGQPGSSARHCGFNHHVETCRPPFRKCHLNSLDRSPTLGKDAFGPPSSRPPTYHAKRNSNHRTGDRQQRPAIIRPTHPHGIGLHVQRAPQIQIGHRRDRVGLCRLLRLVHARVHIFAVCASSDQPAPYGPASSGSHPFARMNSRKAGCPLANGGNHRPSTVRCHQAPVGSSAGANRYS